MEHDPSSHHQPLLNIKLLSPQYHQYQYQPQLYLHQIIISHNPWPHISSSKLLQFLKTINQSYNPISYHNITHAFDVMTSFDQYLIKYGWTQKLKINQHKRIFMLIAAYAHDSGHQGLTNSYYKNINHAWSIQSSSPLQTMHASNLMKIFREHKLEISKQIQKQLIQLILKTDNAYHKQILNEIQIIKKLNNQQLQQQNNKLKMICILLHAADLNNPAKDIELSIQWTNQLYIQFQKQSKLEELYGIPISFIKPIHEIDYIRSNILFLDYMVIPLYKGISEIQNLFIQIYNKIINNRQYWINKLNKINKQSQSIIFQK